MAAAVLRRQWTSPAPTAGDSWRRACPLDSGHEIPETSAARPAWSHPIFHWASPCRNRLWRAPAESRRCDRESAPSGHAPAASTFWTTSSRVMCFVLKDGQACWHQGSWLARCQRTHPAPLPRAATRPGVLPSEDRSALTIVPCRGFIAGSRTEPCRTNTASACGRHPGGEAP
jgi:hypothetical protein